MSTDKDSDAKKGSDKGSEALEIKKSVNAEGKKVTGKTSHKKSVKKKKAAGKKKATTKKSSMKKKSAAGQADKKKKIHAEKNKDIDKAVVKNGIKEEFDAEDISSHQSRTKKRSVGAPADSDNEKPVIGQEQNKNNSLPNKSEPRPESTRPNYVYIILALVVIAIFLYVMLGGPEQEPGPSLVAENVDPVVHEKTTVSSPEEVVTPAESTQSTQSAIIEEQSTLVAVEPVSQEEQNVPAAEIEPVLISVAQLMGHSELDNLRVSALRSLFARGGWDVQRDPDGSLILAAGTVSNQNKPVSEASDFNQQQLVALASLLRPRGWVVRLDAAGNLILIPGSVITNMTHGGSQNSTMEETGLTYLNSLLELRGWQIGTDDSGTMILVPYNASQ